MRKAALVLFYTTVLLVCFNNKSLIAQENDLQSWAMTAVSKKLGPKYFASLIAIHRINDSISRYNDISFDWKFRYKIKNGLSAQVAFRHWTFTQSKPVYFFWYDLIYVQNKPTSRWVNLLRFHHGLDWLGKEQADFLRWRNHYYQSFKVSKLVPFVGYDLWYRFNERNSFQNLWIEAGLEYKIDKVKLRLNYRRITHFDNQPGWKRHVIVIGAFYSFD